MIAYDPFFKNSCTEYRNKLRFGRMEFLRSRRKGAKEKPLNFYGLAALRHRFAVRSMCALKRKIAIIELARYICFHAPQ